MKIFKLKEKGFGTTAFFSEKNAPIWLTSETTIVGSTADHRWFWEKVLDLEVGEMIESDFHDITRILEIPDPLTAIEKNESVRRSAIFKTVKKESSRIRGTMAHNIIIDDSWGRGVLEINQVLNIEEAGTANFVYKKFPFGIIYIYKNRFGLSGWSHKWLKTWRNKL